MSETVEIHTCGPSTAKCKCECGSNGPKCGHQWDGPEWESEDGLSGSSTCSKCGMVRMDHDMWVCP